MNDVAPVLLDKFVKSQFKQGHCQFGVFKGGPVIPNSYLHGQFFAHKCRGVHGHSTVLSPFQLRFVAAPGHVSFELVFQFSQVQVAHGFQVQVTHGFQVQVTQGNVVLSIVIFSSNTERNRTTLR